jgi:hypothetical protein
MVNTHCDVLCCRHLRPKLAVHDGEDLALLGDSAAVAGLQIANRHESKGAGVSQSLH